MNKSKSIFHLAAGARRRPQGHGKHYIRFRRFVNTFFRRRREPAAGIARIAGPVYPDPTALDPQSHYFDAKASTEKNPWSALDVEFVEAFPRVLPLARLRDNPALAELALVQRGSRLSVMPVSEAEWHAVLAMR